MRSARPTKRSTRSATLCELVERLGAEVVACAFLIELSFLDGRERLAPRPVSALINFDD